MDEHRGRLVSAVLECDYMMKVETPLEIASEGERPEPLQGILRMILLMEAC